MSATKKLRLRIHSQISNALGRGNKSGHGPIPCGFISTISNDWELNFRALFPWSSPDRRPSNTP
jgi:hypothetical protein